MKNSLLSKLEKLESNRRAQTERDNKFFALYADAYEKYHDVPDDQAPRSWVRVKEIIRAAQERHHESQNSIRTA